MRRRTTFPCVLSILLLLPPFAMPKSRGTPGPSALEKAEKAMRLFEQGRMLEAEQAWLLALRSDPRYLKAKASLLARNGRCREAAELAERLRSLAPRDPAALELAGRLRLRLGEKKKARALLELALKLDPEASAARCALAGLAMEDGDLARAGKLLEGRSAVDSARFHELSALLAMAGGDLDTALSELKLAARKDPSDMGILARLAETVLASGDAGEARRLCAKGLSLLPGDFDFRLIDIKARLALRQGDCPGGLVDELRDLVRDAPAGKASEARLLLVDLLERKGAYEEALRLCLPAAAGGRGRLPRAVLLKASNLCMKVAAEREKRGARQKADLAFTRSIELLQQALADDPSHEATRNLLTERYIELGKHYFEYGKKASSPRLRQQLYGYAIFNLERAVELEPKMENRAHMLLGRLLNHIDRHEEAIEHFSRIKDELSHFVESIYSYGESCLALRRYLDASIAFNRVIRIKPDHWRALRDLGLTYWQLKAVKKAEKCLKKALGLHTGDASVWYHLGKIRLSQGRYGDAAVCLRKVLKLAAASTGGKEQAYFLDARHLLEELPSRQKADRKLKALGGRPVEDELDRRLYGR